MKTTTKCKMEKIQVTGPHSPGEKLMALIWAAPTLTDWVSSPFLALYSVTLPEVVPTATIWPLESTAMLVQGFWNEQCQHEDALHQHLNCSVGAIRTNYQFYNQRKNTTLGMELSNVLFLLTAHCPHLTLCIRFENHTRMRSYDLKKRCRQADNKKFEENGITENKICARGRNRI